MSIAQLFNNGLICYAETSRETVIRALEKDRLAARAAGKTPVMTLGYEKAVVDTAYELAGFPLFDILLYIKKYMDTYDPEAGAEDLEDEE